MAGISRISTTAGDHKSVTTFKRFVFGSTIKTKPVNKNKYFNTTENNSSVLLHSNDLLI